MLSAVELEKEYTVATTYVGTRPILKGRTLATAVNTYTGKVMKYSNWLLMSPDHVLDGAPDRQYVVGQNNRYAKARFLAQQFAGTAVYVSPLTAPGLGARQADGRYRPFEFKGLAGAAVFPSNFGHAPFRNLYYSEYSNDIFDGVPSAITLTGGGHVRRFNAPWGGAFDPYANKGVSVQPFANPGKVAPADALSPYGHNRVREWRGVPSSRAL